MLRYWEEQAKGGKVSCVGENRIWVMYLLDGRNDPKVAAGVPSKKWAGDKTERQTHLEGLWGEFGGCAYWGLIWIPSFSLGGDKGAPDLHFPDGTSVEVKYRTWWDYEYALVDDNPKSFKADVGLLCLPGPAPWVIHVCSFITKADFLEHCETADFGMGKRKKVRREFMTDARELEGCRAPGLHHVQ